MFGSVGQFLSWLLCACAVLLIILLFVGFPPRVSAV